MISHQYFNEMPKDGALLKDILNWFVLGYKNMHKQCKKKNHYYSGTIEIGYCGSDLSEVNDTYIEISLIHTGSWGFESFEQTSISISTNFKVESHESFFVCAESVNNLPKLTQQIKDNSIFSDLMLKKITEHHMDFGGLDG
ncbi:MAG: hypothetical protein GY777_22280 [Candidatus Brocadiaceae bacterium]|nr:hypothetical protein [Candidatus Brocadiaceae bacterium]